MKRIVIGLAAVIVLYATGQVLYRVLASDETKIRWLLEETADAFNRMSPRDCTAALADDFEERSGASKEQVRLYLAGLYFRARDPRTKEFIYSVELPPEEVEVAVAEGGTASVRLLARFTETRDGSVKLAWEVRIDASLAKGDDGWRIKRASHETVRGKRLK